MTQELAKRLVADGYFVTLLTSHYPGASYSEEVDGIDVVRVGSHRYSQTFQALGYYVRYLRDKYDLIIETVNTAPYHLSWWRKKERMLLFYHQLAREIWDYETPFPLNILGFNVLEPAATLLNAVTKAPVVTVSKSTKDDLMKWGFSSDRISIVSEGITLTPLLNLTTVTKYPQPTVLVLGSIRSMKRTDHAIRAFEIAKAQLPHLRLIIAGGGSGHYADKVRAQVNASPYRNDIDMLGSVSETEKIDLLQQSHVLLCASVKEGWGLVVTEANSQGTPAIVYDVDGLRDSVKHDQTGVVTIENTPIDMAKQLVLLLSNKEYYERLRRSAWEWSKEITFAQSYHDFRGVLADRFGEPTV